MSGWHSDHHLRIPPLRLELGWNMALKWLIMPFLYWMFYSSEWLPVFNTGCNILGCMWWMYCVGSGSHLYFLGLIGDECCYSSSCYCCCCCCCCVVCLCKGISMCKWVFVFLCASVLVVVCVCVVNLLLTSKTLVESSFKVESHMCGKHSAH